MAFPPLSHGHHPRIPWAIVGLAVAIVSLLLAVSGRWMLAFGLLLALIGGASWKSADSTPGAIAALIALPLLAFGLGWRPSLSLGSHRDAQGSWPLEAPRPVASAPMPAGPLEAPRPVAPLRASCTEGATVTRGRAFVERVYDRTCHGNRQGLVVDVASTRPPSSPSCSVGAIIGGWETVYDSDCEHS